jgi:hypothetical protein
LQAQGAEAVSDQQVHGTDLSHVGPLMIAGRETAWQTDVRGAVSPSGCDYLPRTPICH